MAPRALGSGFPAVRSLCAARQGVDVDPILWVRPNRQVRAPDLPSLTAPSDQAATVLSTALEIIVHNRAICCAKGSALEDAVLSDTADRGE
jgi:hypothetical protein